jgi:hypothetical protein
VLNQAIARCNLLRAKAERSTSHDESTKSRRQDAPSRANGLMHLTRKS